LRYPANFIKKMKRSASLILVILVILVNLDHFRHSINVLYQPIETRG
jgi:hypothetical protein